MPPSIATVFFFALIAAMFALDRDRRAHTSPALWIPVSWLLIIASRPLSSWMAVIGLGQAAELDRPDQLIEGSPTDRVGFLILIALATVVVALRRTSVMKLVRSNAWAMLFLAYCFVSTLWADYPDVAFKRWIKALGDFMMIAIVITERDPAAAVKRLLVRTGFILVPLSVLFIKFFPQFGRAYHIWSWTPMYTGVTLTKNMLGVMCLVVGVGSLWCLLNALSEYRGMARSRHVLAHMLMLSMVVWLLWMANSMTSIMCLSIAGATIIAACSRFITRHPAFIHVMVAGVVIGCSVVLFMEDATGALSTLGRDPTFTGRTGIWSMVISMSENPVIGAGFESFWTGERLEEMWRIDHGAFRGIQSAHNGYLEVYLNIGIAGVVLLAMLLAASYRMITRALRHDPRQNKLGLAFFVVALVYNFSEAGFRMVTPIWFVLMLGIMMSTLSKRPFSRLPLPQTTRIQTPPVWTDASLVAHE